jgi:hypothetical protein
VRRLGVRRQGRCGMRNWLLKTGCFLVVMAGALPSCRKAAPSEVVKDSTCSLHGVLLQEDDVPIHNGMRTGGAPGLLEAEKSLFPNANDCVYHGCIRTEPPGAKVHVFYCPTCRAARARWELQHLDPTCPPRPHAEASAGKR